MGGLEDEESRREKGVERDVPKEDAKTCPQVKSEQAKLAQKMPKRINRGGKKKGGR